MRRAVEAEQAKAVVIDAENVPFIDVTAVRVLDRLAEELEHDGVRLLIARDVGQVRDVIHEAGADEGLQRVYRSVGAAVEAAVGAAGR